MTITRTFPASAVVISYMLVTACVTAPQQALSVNRCVIRSEGTLGISAHRLELAPGESVQLDKPAFFTAPYLPADPLPANCGVRWAVTDGATIDGSGRLTIDPDARPGSTVIVRAQVDTSVAQQTVHVIDPAPNPLAGTWTQNSPTTCANAEQPGDAIVRELVFRRGQTFAVTRVPFESYRDYWGTYAYDVPTGGLRLTVEAGNSLPAFRSARMTARVADGELTLEGPALAGTRSSASGCRSIFKRLGDPR